MIILNVSYIGKINYIRRTLFKGTLIDDIQAHIFLSCLMNRAWHIFLFLTEMGWGMIFWNMMHWWVLRITIHKSSAGAGDISIKTGIGSSICYNTIKTRKQILIKCLERYKFSFSSFFSSILKVHQKWQKMHKMLYHKLGHITYFCS